MLQPYSKERIEPERFLLSRFLIQDTLQEQDEDDIEKYEQLAAHWQKTLEKFGYGI
jgi:hypothetical protein